MRTVTLKLTHHSPPQDANHLEKPKTHFFYRQCTAAWFQTNKDPLFLTVADIHSTYPHIQEQSTSFTTKHIQPHTPSHSNKKPLNPHRAPTIYKHALPTPSSIPMAPTSRQQPSPPQSTSRRTKSTHHRNTLSSLLHTTLSTILPLLFFTTFVIAGTIVLSYSLSLNEPVPARFVVGVSAAFAALIGLSIWVFVWSRVHGVWKAGKSTNRQGGRIDSRPTATESDADQPHPQLVRQQHQRIHNFATPPSSNAPIANPLPIYRSLLPLPPFFHHQHVPPPRRGSVELSAIPERSTESDHGAFPLFSPYTPNFQHPARTDARRPPPTPTPYRSPSVASLPESLQAPGRGAETPNVTTQGPRRGHSRRMHHGMRQGSVSMASPGLSPSPAIGSGPMQLPMPQVPEPLVFGPSITGRGGGAGWG